MQSHHNSNDGDNNESLVIPKKCDKTETQATKKHVFRWKKKDALVFENHHEEAFTDKLIEVYRPYKYFKPFFTDDSLLIIQICITPKILVKASILLLMKCQHLLTSK